MWVIRLNYVDWVYFKTQILLETLRIQNQPRRNPIYFRKSNICSLAYDVQEANMSISQFHRIGVISLDAGLRMDGVLAFDLWDVVIDVPHSSNNNKSPTEEASGNRSGFKEAAGNCSRMSNTKLRRGKQNV